MKTIELTNEQRTLGWHKARLGVFTASKVGELFAAKGGISKTAMSYVYNVASGRKTVDEYWDVWTDEERLAYIDRISEFVSKDMQRGIDLEPMIRKLFEFQYDKVVVEKGTCTTDTTPNITASPDGVIEAENALLEIKSVKEVTFAQYAHEVKDNASLKETTPKYYWQIMQQMYVMQADKCYFAFYNETHGLKVVEILRDQTEIDNLLKRINEAEELVREIYKDL